MRITGMMMVAALGMAAMSVPAMAQQVGGYTPTPQQLDQMSKERIQETGPRNWGPPPPQSSLPKEKIIPLNDLWVCMSAKQWQPIYASPSGSAAVIGKTLSQAAVGGKSVNGFDPVLVRAGRIGYVRASDVSPYSSQFRPGSTCTVEGVRPNGTLVFGYN